MQVEHLGKLQSVRRILGRTTGRLEAAQQGLLDLIAEVEAQRTLLDEVLNLQTSLQTAQVTCTT